MKNLEVKEVQNVRGGDGDIATIRANTKTAIKACGGKENVKSVSTTGYSCKSE
ncbi:hypothetical protein [Aquimarina longa]|uniref:hypothetical protein n=1 Tax=Aquimarina longa TaxID=1080221 RepID=UPI000A886525|nr:hypothetical protein [Aquimarina longa]